MSIDDDATFRQRPPRISHALDDDLVELTLRTLEPPDAPCSTRRSAADRLSAYAHAGETPQPLHRLGSDEMLVPAEDFTVARQLEQLLPFTTEALGRTSRWSRYFGGVARIGAGHNSA